MKAQSNASDTLGALTYRRLREQIVNGQLKPGQRLSLRGVASDLGVSMAPVGEAFRELARDGLLESEPGWGTRVRQITAESLRSQHVLRTAVECEAARQCSQLATAEQLDELRQLADELDQRIDTKAPPDQIHGLDSQFHLRVAELSGAPSLLEALKANQLLRMLDRGSVLAQSRDQPSQQHVQLATAISSRHPDVADAAMREHCQRSMQLQLSAMTGTPTGTPSF